MIRDSRPLKTTITSEKEGPLVKTILYTKLDFRIIKGKRGESKRLSICLR